MSAAAEGSGTMSCAETYATLSHHPKFEEAMRSSDLDQWVGRLNAASGVKGRTAMEVETASVMGVLKMFDRRFGRG
jgi:hypothetical protein